MLANSLPNQTHPNLKIEHKAVQQRNGPFIPQCLCQTCCQVKMISLPVQDPYPSIPSNSICLSKFLFKATIVSASTTTRFRPPLCKTKLARTSLLNFLPSHLPAMPSSVEHLHLGEKGSACLPHLCQYIALLSSPLGLKPRTALSRNAGVLSSKVLQ